MQPIEKVFELDDGEAWTLDTLRTFIDRHRRLCVRYQELLDLYTGRHPILTKQAKADYKPDNRLVVNYARYIVDTFNGYFIGVPVRTVSDKASVSDYIQFLETYNALDDNNADLAKKSSIYGHAYELLFIDEEGQIGITNLSPMECFLVYDTSIRQHTRYGVRYQVLKDNVIRGTYSDEEKIYYFVIDSDGVRIESEIEHYFGAVPLVEYVENEERIGAFEFVETLIKSYDQAMSEKANDVDYFSDAYMKILGADLDEQTLRSIRDHRIINLSGADSEHIVVEFMEKPNADATQENLLNRLEKQIFAISMVANINDDQFATSSGIALKYKLQSMSNLANTKERKFSKGFHQRFDLIARSPAGKLQPEDLISIDYVFTRNIPTNLTEEAQNARALQGIVSDETVLRTLSVVPDVKAEMARIEDESNSSVLHDVTEDREES